MGILMVLSIILLIAIILAVVAVVLYNIFEFETFGDIALGSMRIMLITFLMILGSSLITYNNEVNNDAQWERQSSGIIAEISDNQYVIETDEEYIYQTIYYSDTGKPTEEYVSIDKNEDTYVEFVNVESSETATYTIFTANNQTKYVFYIPEWKTIQSKKRHLYNASFLYFY